MKISNDIYIKQPRNVAPEVVKTLSNSEKNIIIESASKKSEKPEDLDTLELYLKEKEAALEALNQKEMMDSELAASKSQIEGAIKMFDVLLKCMKIACRIIDGDKVPKQDEQLLMENYPDLYSAAKTLQRQKEERKEHKSLADKIEEPSEPSAPADNSELRTQITDSIAQIKTAIAEHS